jgi:hypothetical protein
MGRKPLVTPFVLRVARERGISAQVVAEFLGVSKGAVSRACRKYGIELPDTRGRGFGVMHKTERKTA